jgi:hypothetical protein
LRPIQAPSRVTMDSRVESAAHYQRLLQRLGNKTFEERRQIDFTFHLVEQAARVDA